MSKQPTKKQRSRWEKLRELGCIICGSPASIHHCGTGGGGRKDHDKVLNLCYEHHQGKENGIHGDLGRRKWQEIYGTEQQLMDKANTMIGE